MTYGYLQLNRRFFATKMWNEARTFSSCEAWLDLVRSARFDAAPLTVSIGGREVTYGTGQFPASIRFLARRWKWTEKRVRSFLSKLRREQLVTTESNRGGVTILTITDFRDAAYPLHPERESFEEDANMFDAAPKPGATEARRQAMQPRVAAPSSPVEGTPGAQSAPTAPQTVSTPAQEVHTAGTNTIKEEEGINNIVYIGDFSEGFVLPPPPPAEQRRREPDAWDRRCAENASQIYGMGYEPTLVGYEPGISGSENNFAAEPQTFSAVPSDGSGTAARQSRGNTVEHCQDGFAAIYAEEERRFRPYHPAETAAVRRSPWPELRTGDTDRAQPHAERTEKGHTAGTNTIKEQEGINNLVYKDSVSGSFSVPSAAPRRRTTTADDAERRKQAFREILRPYEGRYGREMVENFFGYWSEKTRNGSRLRFELQPTWELAARLAYWKKRGDNYIAQRQNRGGFGPSTGNFDLILRDNSVSKYDRGEELWRR